MKDKKKLEKGSKKKIKGIVKQSRRSKEVTVFCELIEQYLSSKKSPSTRIRYRKGFELFVEFQKDRGEDPSLEKFLNAVAADRQLPVGSRKHPEITTLNAFIDYLQGYKYAPKTTNVFVNAICGFLRRHDMPVYRDDLKTPAPLPLKKNRKISIGKEEILKLRNHCTTTRDRALITCLWNSGASIGTLLDLNISDLKTDNSHLGSLDDPPLTLHAIRRKSHVEYVTFFGKDACNDLKEYLGRRERQYGKPAYNDPLFVKFISKTGTLERLNVASVDSLFMRLTIRSGIISDDKLKNADLNPCRPHAIRGGFSSTLQYIGINSDIINGLSGHKVPFDGAYSTLTPRKLRELYIEKIYPALELYEAVDSEKLLKEVVEGQKRFNDLKSQLDVMRERAEIQATRAGGTQAAIVSLVHYLVKNSNDPELEKVAANIEKNLGNRGLTEASLDDLKGTGIKKLKKIKLVD